MLQAEQTVWMGLGNDDMDRICNRKPKYDLIVSIRYNATHSSDRSVGSRPDNHNAQEATKRHIERKNHTHFQSTIEIVFSYLTILFFYAQSESMSGSRAATNLEWNQIKTKNRKKIFDFYTNSKWKILFFDQMLWIESSHDFSSHRAGIRCLIKTGLFVCVCVRDTKREREREREQEIEQDRPFVKPECFISLPFHCSATGAPSWP